LRSVSTDHEVVEVSSNSKNIESSVFEQIEPKIIELASFVEKSEEKQLLKMRLNPAELGEVEIRIEKDSSGKIHAHIRTENESARHILAESLGQLRDTLQNSGWQIERLEVSCNPNQSSGNEQRENGSRENETARNNVFGFDGNVENEDEKQENPADRLVNLRA
jgi:flagellar hook-length control protein FliK